MKRKMTVLLLIAAMLLSMLGTTAMAAEPAERTVTPRADTASDTMSEIKLMTFNVLNNNSGSTITGTPAQRAAVIAQMIATYTPDVIGFQEAGDGGTSSNVWENQLRANLTGYSGLRSFSDNKADVFNGQMIFYRSDKYQYVSSGHTAYTAYDSNDTYSPKYNYEWAELREKSTGRTFFVFNTHWPLNTHQTLEYNTKMRQTQINILNNAIKQKAGTNPVFILGDFNSSYAQRDASVTDGTNYMKFLNTEGYCDALLAAPTKNIDSETINKCIDHVVYHPSTATVTDAVYIKKNDFTSSSANAMSDHPAIMVTLQFPGGDNTHVHAMDTTCSTTEGSMKTFHAINSTGGTLKAGNYYLPANIDSLAGNLVVSSGTVNLCLNGHTLHSKKMHIEVTGGTLNICDCDGSNGFIYGWNTDGEGIIYVNGGTVNLYGGTVRHTKSASAVQSEDVDVNKVRGIFVKKGTLNIFGGAVGNVTSNAITVDATGALNVTGGTISSNAKNAISNTGTSNVTGGTLTGVSACIWNQGTLTVGGSASITGNVGINNSKSSTYGTLNITGGTITGTNTCAVNNAYASNTLNLKGAPVLNSVTADFSLSNSSYITLNGALTGGPYTVATATAPTVGNDVRFTTNLSTGMAVADCAQHFVPANGSYAVRTASNEGYLHIHTPSGTVTGASSATCSTPGYTGDTLCASCGGVAIAGEAIPTTAHTVVTDAAVPATCTQTGLTAGSHCSVCNTVIAAQEIVPALGHDIIGIPETPATCTETGLTAGGYCSRCDYTSAQDIIPALGHDMITDAAVPATCTETGLSAGQHCSRCDAATVAQEIIPALGHDIVTDAAVPATCTETGLTAGQHCSRCDAATVAQDVIPALGHDYIYTSNGDDHTVTCSRCDYSLTEAHTYENGVCVCGAEEESFGILSASLRLHRDIDVIFTVSVPEGAQNVKLMVDTDNETVTLSDYETDGSNLRFIYADLNPQQIGDALTVTLSAKIDGKTKFDYLYDYSIRQYCINILNKPSYSNDAKLHTLLSDLLTYGAAAQAYTGYRTDALATAGLDLTPSTFTPISGKIVSFNGTADAAIDWTSAGLVLSDSVTMRFTFRAAITDNLTVKICINGREESFTAFETDANGRYYVDFRGINATEFDDTVSAAFYRNGTAIGRTVNYSVNTYICSTQNSANANLQALVRTLYNYGNSAANYAISQ